MHFLSLLALLLSLLYFVTSCAPNGGLVPTPSPGEITDAPGEEEATQAAEEEAAAEEKRRRRNVMRSSVEQIDHPLPDLHEFLVRNDSVKMIVHDGREGR